MVINKDHIETYSTIIFIQPLSGGRRVREIYTKVSNGWEVTYDSNASQHICPYDGIFRDCKVCGALDDDFDIKYCTNKIKRLNSKTVVDRIKKCQAAGLDVQFIDQEILMDKYSCKLCKCAGKKELVRYKIIEDDGNHIRFIGMLCEDCFSKIFDGAPSTEDINEEPQKEEE